MDASKVITAHFTSTPKLVIGQWNGSISLWLYGVSGAPYRLEASTNLLTWTPLVTGTNFFGTVQLNDPAFQVLPYRMYRAIRLP